MDHAQQIDTAELDHYRACPSCGGPAWDDEHAADCHFAPVVRY